VSAHDSSTDAHSNPPPGDSRPTMVNVDKTGVSMSWKTAVGVIGFIILGMVTLMTFTGTLLKADDLVKHNTSSTAHAQLPAHEDPIKKAEVVTMIAPIQEQAQTTSDAVIKVRNGFYEQRASDLAYRAVDRLPRSAGGTARIRRFERVKKKALKNQQAGRDILDGIDVPVM